MPKKVNKYELVELECYTQNFFLLKIQPALEIAMLLTAHLQVRKNAVAELNEFK